MIHFNYLKYKNFLSTGDQYTTIQLDKSITTVVTGTNGAGKSTFIDALVYGLFGKPFRKIRLGQLINNVNETGLEVEVSFTIANKTYKIIRGQKPAKFEIYNNDELIPQPATTADYQDILESDILKLNYKSFTQIIILGSASFVPFMQLKLADRREVIENILDITVFSQMNQLLKVKLKELREEITDTEHKKYITKERYNTKREFLLESEKSYNERIQYINKHIDELLDNIRLCEIDISVHEEYIESLKEEMESYKGYGDKANQIRDQLSGIKTEIGTLEVKFKLLTDNNNVVDGIIRKIKDCEEEVSSKKNIVDDLKLKLSDIVQKIDEYPDVSEERDDLKAIVVTLINRINDNNRKIKFYNETNDCSECGQIIHEEFRSDIVSKLSSEVDVDKVELKNTQERLEKIDTDTEVKAQYIKDKLSIDNEILAQEGIIDRLENSIKLMRSDIKSRETADPGEMGDLNHYINTLRERYIVEEESGKEAKEKHAKYNEVKDKRSEIIRKLDVDKERHNSYSKRLIEANNELDEMKKAPVCSISENDIEELSNDIKELDNAIVKMKTHGYYFGIVQKLLKDDGLKTKIIKRFLPIINATVNMYLDKFDFPIEFTFDENFNETIQSKHRNDFSYFSFSEGEKARIDLALLFTWRDIALKKSRNATNIIIFDEIFDGSLDGAGIENFMNILGINEEGYNSFIISHKDDTINSRFDRNLDFSRNGHFSKLKEN